MAEKLQGEKVYLAPIEEGDLEHFVHFMNDMEMTLFTGTFPGLYGIEEERQYFAKDSSKCQMAIHSKESGQTIGLVELMDISSVNRCAEIGISIGEAENREQGFGREAMSLMIEFAFLALNLESLYLSCLDKNTRARKLYESLGFKVAGTLRRHRYVGGRYCNILYMDLLKEEYQGKILEKQINTFISF